MKKKSLERLLLVFIFALSLSSLTAQLSGKVTDSNDVPLSYVNIFVKNTSTGTTSNLDGNYSLKLDPGQYTIVFQYIGYSTKEKLIDYNSTAKTLDVQLEEASYVMPEVTIEANAEDPAYAIIRKAQERRKYYQDQNDTYSYDAYVRGFNKIFNAPEKIMGVEVGDLDGNLDSTRQGVIYLSESVSKVYVSGGKTKEVMYSSKVSGNDRGYSFNSAQEMDFNFYNNSIDLNRHIISPIGTNAMATYSYELVGATIDENGQLVNKIKVTPKSNFSPAFFGFIYINEDLWNINSLELSVTREATQIPFIDTLSFTQSYIPLEKSRWLPISNVIRFRMSALGFDVGGTFACVYSNYTLDTIDESVFNREVYVVKSEANTRPEKYWDSIRPIPLTGEEKLDYKRKDSIQIVRESPEYLDSIDQESNRLKAGDVLGGYNYQNSTKHNSWAISTPLSSFDVNTIMGWNGAFGFSYTKRYDKEGRRRLNINTALNYAFSDNQWRPRAELSYRANRTNNLSFTLKGGRELQQFNRVEPITRRLNSIMTLFFRRNYLKAYDKKYLAFEMSRNIGAIFRLQSSIDYEDRSTLENTYDGSLFYKDSRSFTPNIVGFEDHQALIFRLSLRIRPGAQLVRYPKRTFRTSSDWPTLYLNLKHGISALGADSKFSLLHARISKEYSLKNLGDFNFNIHGGIFLDTPEFFIDQMHFMGNQTHLGYSPAYDYSFLLAPYYGLSTSGDFLQLHFHHNFKGFLINRIPGIRWLGWHVVGGYKYLMREGSDYQEWHIGFDNVGYRFFRPLRIDLVWSDQLNVPVGETDIYSRFGIVVGLDFRI